MVIDTSEFKEQWQKMTHDEKLNYLLYKMNDLADLNEVWFLFANQINNKIDLMAESISLIAEKIVNK